jgi:DNA integrity scanning protein DisA with diadenylate cyclase activity
VHEGRRSTYGSLVFEGADLPEESEVIQFVDVPDHEAARELADGLRTFVLRTAEGDSALAYADGTTEARLKTLAVELECDIVQRHPTGAVRVFGRERLLIFENDNWSSKPYAHTRWMAVHSLAGIRTHADVMFELLDFALHVLSPRNVGATFVLMLDGTASNLSGFSRVPRALGAKLNILSPSPNDALATVLATVDGACVIEADGTVYGIEAMFSVSLNATKLISVAGAGARHNSAARFSFDHPETLVVVVSADGPVTVFSDGRSLLQLNPASTWMSVTEEYAPHLTHATRESVKVEACPQCKKRIQITIAYIDAESWNDETACACPVCGFEPLYSAECFSIRGEVLKPWQ